MTIFIVLRRVQERTEFAVMATRRYAFGRADEATHPDSMRATLAEFVSTFIFVFAGEGSGLALGLYIYSQSWFILHIKSALKFFIVFLRSFSYIISACANYYEPTSDSVFNSY